MDAFIEAFWSFLTPFAPMLVIVALMGALALVDRIERR